MVSNFGSPTLPACFSTTPTQPDTRVAKDEGTTDLSTRELEQIFWSRLGVIFFVFPVSLINGSINRNSYISIF